MVRREVDPVNSKRYGSVTDVLQDPAVHPHDKAEIATFARFLQHHGSPSTHRAICSCGIAARRGEDGEIYAVANPDCECPCHEPGYAAK